MSIANTKQVGGSHYATQIQHWDFIEQNGIGYLEGCATKYITRNRKKHRDPEEDVEKALHYVEKLQELAKAGVKRPRTQAMVIPTAAFAKANGLNETEEAAITNIAEWKTLGDLQNAWEIVWGMLQELRYPEPA